MKNLLFITLLLTSLSVMAGDYVIVTPYTTDLELSIAQNEFKAKFDHLEDHTVNGYLIHDDLYDLSVGSTVETELGQVYLDSFNSAQGYSYQDLGFLLKTSQISKLKTFFSQNGDKSLTGLSMEEFFLKITKDRNDFALSQTHVSSLKDTIVSNTNNKNKTIFLTHSKANKYIIAAKQATGNLQGKYVGNYQIATSSTGGDIVSFETVWYGNGQEDKFLTTFRPEFNQPPGNVSIGNGCFDDIINNSNELNIDLVANSCANGSSIVDVANNHALNSGYNSGIYGLSNTDNNQNEARIKNLMDSLGPVINLSVIGDDLFGQNIYEFFVEPIANINIINFEVDFGDGTPIISKDNTNFVHKFENHGNYTIKAKVNYYDQFNVYRTSDEVEFQLAITKSPIDRFGCGYFSGLEYGQRYINPDATLGGFVSNQATVIPNPDLYIMADAEICGTSVVMGTSTIASGPVYNTIITDSMVYGSIVNNGEIIDSYFEWGSSLNGGTVIGSTNFGIVEESVYYDQGTSNPAQAILEGGSTNYGVVNGHVSNYSTTHGIVGPSGVVCDGGEHFDEIINHRQYCPSDPAEIRLSDLIIHKAGEPGFEDKPKSFVQIEVSPDALARVEARGGIAYSSWTIQRPEFYRRSKEKIDIYFDRAGPRKVEVLFKYNEYGGLSDSGVITINLNVDEYEEVRSTGCNGEPGKKYIGGNGVLGGFVADTAQVGYDNFIGVDVEICGNSIIETGSAIDGNSIITDSQINNSYINNSNITGSIIVQSEIYNTPVINSQLVQGTRTNGGSISDTTIRDYTTLNNTTATSTYICGGQYSSTNLSGTNHCNGDIVENFDILNYFYFPDLYVFWDTFVLSGIEEAKYFRFLSADMERRHDNKFAYVENQNPNICNGEEYGQWINPDGSHGGFVAYSTFVSGDMIVHPTAVICNNSRITSDGGDPIIIPAGSILDSASISNTKLLGTGMEIINSVVSNSEILGNAYIYNSFIDDSKLDNQGEIHWAIINFAEVYGTITFCEDPQYRYTRIKGNSELGMKVYGSLSFCDSRIEGDLEVCGGAQKVINDVLDSTDPLVSCSDQDKIDANTSGPLASFTVDANQGHLAQVFNFDASNSERAVSYQWDFGDGQTLETMYPQIKHMFNSTGNHQVTLTVVDEDNITRTTTANINVSLAPAHSINLTTAQNLVVIDDAFEIEIEAGTFENGMATLTVEQVESNSLSSSLEDTSTFFGRRNVKSPYFYKITSSSKINKSIKLRVAPPVNEFFESRNARYADLFLDTHQYGFERVGRSTYESVGSPASEIIATIKPDDINLGASREVTLGTARTFARLNETLEAKGFYVSDDDQLRDGYLQARKVTLRGNGASGFSRVQFNRPVASPKVLQHHGQLEVANNDINNISVKKGMTYSATVESSYNNQVQPLTDGYLLKASTEPHPVLGYNATILHAGGTVTRYSHLKESVLNFFQLGDYIAGNQKIGDLGTSGQTNGTNQVHIDAVTLPINVSPGQENITFNQNPLNALAHSYVWTYRTRVVKGNGFFSYEMEVSSAAGKVTIPQWAQYAEVDLSFSLPLNLNKIASRSLASKEISISDPKYSNDYSLYNDDINANINNRLSKLLTGEQPATQEDYDFPTFEGLINFSYKGDPTIFPEAITASYFVNGGGVLWTAYPLEYTESPPYPNWFIGQKSGQIKFTIGKASQGPGDNSDGKSDDVLEQEYSSQLNNSLASSLNESGLPGIAASLQDGSRDPAQLKEDFNVDGNVCSSSNMPINFADGEMWHEFKDIPEIAGPGPKLYFTRMYRSKLERNSDIGFNWSHNYNIRIANKDGSQPDISSNQDLDFYSSRNTASPFYFESGAYKTTNDRRITLDTFSGEYVLTDKDKTEYFFYGSGQLAGKIRQIRDRNNNTMSFGYSSGQLDYVEDAVGRRLNFEYSNGKISKVSDFSGRSVSFTYDGDDLISSTDLNGNVGTYSYLKGVYPESLNHNMVSYKDARGNGADYLYNEDDKAIRHTEPEGRVLDIQHFDFEDKVVVSDSAGNVKTHYLDIYGNITKTINPDDSEILFAYDSFGNLESQTDELGFIKTFESDTFGNPSKTILPAPYGSTTVSYDSNFNIPNQIEDANGNVKNLVLDNYGNVEEIQETVTIQGSSELLKTILTYDGLGQVASIKDAKNNLTQINRVRNPDLSETVTTTNAQNNSSIQTFDSLGRLVESVSFEGVTTQFSYDNQGNLKSSEVLGSGVLREFDYDDANNLVLAKTTSAGTTQKVSYTYDGLNNLTSITDENNNTTTMNYDVVNCGCVLDGKVRELIDPKGNKTTFTYNFRGDLTQKVTQDGTITNISYNLRGEPTEVNVTTSTGTILSQINFEYDVAGNVSKKIETIATNSSPLLSNYWQLNVPDMAQTVTDYSYDPVGNLVSSTISKGSESQTISYSYNEANLLITKSNSNDGYNEMTSYKYDKNLNTVEISNNNSILNYVYDSLDRVSSVTTTQNNTSQPNTVLNYSYNLDNQVTSVTDGLGAVISEWDYDSLNRLQTVTTIKGSTSITRDIFERIENITNTNGTVQTNSYDLGNRITSMATPGVENFGFEYDLNSNISKITSTDNESILDYDVLDQITASTNSGGRSIASESFDWDGNGNPIHNNANVEMDVLLNKGSKELGYDFKGNLTETFDNNTGEKEVLSYNADNQLRKYEKFDNSEVLVKTIEYFYDGLGRRIEKLTDGTEARSYVYDRDNILFEYDNGNEHAQYVSTGRIDDHLGVIINDEMYTYHKDHLGSIQVITDSNGDTVQNFFYTSFGEIDHVEDGSGNVLDKSQWLDQAYAYTGREYDKDSELYYYRARFYNASLQRFISKDPIGLFAGDTNFFRYVFNRPSMYIDPTGLDVFYNNRIDNPLIREMLNEVDQSLPGIDIVITGGDRFIDEIGEIRSSTTGNVVTNSSLVSRHISGNAVDFYLGKDGQRLNYTPADFQDIVNRAGFNNVIQYSPTGRFHVDIGVQIGENNPRRNVCE